MLELSTLSVNLYLTVSNRSFSCVVSGVSHVWVIMLNSYRVQPLISFDLCQVQRLVAFGLCRIRQQVSFGDLAR